MIQYIYMVFITSWLLIPALIREAITFKRYETIVLIIDYLLIMDALVCLATLIILLYKSLQLIF